MLEIENLIKLEASLFFVTTLLWMQVACECAAIAREPLTHTVVAEFNTNITVYY